MISIQPHTIIMRDIYLLMWSSMRLLHAWLMYWAVQKSYPMCFQWQVSKFCWSLTSTSTWSESVNKIGKKRDCPHFKKKLIKKIRQIRSLIHWSNLKLDLQWKRASLSFATVSFYELECINSQERSTDWEKKEIKHCRDCAWKSWDWIVCLFLQRRTGRNVQSRPRPLRLWLFWRKMVLWFGLKFCLSVSRQ